MKKNSLTAVFSAFFLLLSAFTLVQDTPLPIIKKLISKKCSGSRSSSKAVEYVMLHFCSDAIQNPKNPHNLDRIIEIFETYGVSAHYLIDREGKIYQLVEENRVAYHAGKGSLPHEPHHQNSLNGRSLGIEMMAVGSKKEMKIFMSENHYDKIKKEDTGFTEAQYTSLEKLLADIEKRHPKVKHNRKHIVGHDEYAPNRRCDPGELFDWEKVGL